VIAQAGKPGAAPSPIPLLPPWLAFVCAGLCTTVAGYLAMTVTTWTRAYSETGVQLPWATTVVVDAPVLLPLGLVLVSALILAAGGPRLSASWVRPARPFAALIALGAAATSGLLFWAVVLAFVAVQKTLNH
jgi:hypothetical protein